MIGNILSVIRGKYGATYSMGSFFDILNPDFMQLSVLFATDPLNADQIKNIALSEMEKFMLQGVNENDFNIRKNRYIIACDNDLKNNKWWVNYALYKYYFHNQNIVSDYMRICNNLSLEGLKEFTRNIYLQGNIIEVIMKPE